MLSMLEIVKLTEKYFLFLVISNKIFGRFVIRYGNKDMYEIYQIIEDDFETY